jgi:N6-L-threonylcarbamoyladenine synthase
MRVLGIESSCDETSAAVVEDGRRVLSNVVASQETLHVPYGGVVPEIACRAHVLSILPTIQAALGEARLALTGIDAVAVVHRPGLIGSLLVGVTAAKTLAWALARPLVGVDHIQAHLYAAALDRDEAVFPAAGLVVSGGHTSLFHCRSPLDIERLGATTDDAAGEAFDKVASILGLGYPGGPVIDRVARQGDARAVSLPRPCLEEGSLDFSFSGLKTAVLYHCRGGPRATRQGRGVALTPRQTADVAAGFQEAVVDVLVAKAVEACLRCGERRLVVGGGVACNSRLRERLGEAARRHGLSLCLADRKYCPDNAAMAAGLAFHLCAAGRVAPLTLDAEPR